MSHGATPRQIQPIALDPEFLLLDEPATGLDPIMAEQIDHLIHDRTKNLEITVVRVTHDIDTLHAICDRVAVLADKMIVATAPIHEFECSSYPWVRQYLLGKRSRVRNIIALK